MHRLVAVPQAHKQPPGCGQSAGAGLRGARRVLYGPSDTLGSARVQANEGARTEWSARTWRQTVTQGSMAAPAACSAMTSPSRRRHSSTGWNAVSENARVDCGPHRAHGAVSGALQTLHQTPRGHRRTYGASKLLVALTGCTAGEALGLLHLLLTQRGRLHMRSAKLLACAFLIHCYAYSGSLLPGRSRAPPRSPRSRRGPTQRSARAGPAWRACGTVLRTPGCRTRNWLVLHTAPCIGQIRIYGFWGARV